MANRLPGPCSGASGCRDGGSRRFVGSWRICGCRMASHRHQPFAWSVSRPQGAERIDRQSNPAHRPTRRTFADELPQDSCLRYTRMMSRSWEDVSHELDCWATRGLKARFWVRDDDACEMSTPLARLHELAMRHDITVGLAIIP